MDDHRLQIASADLPVQVAVQDVKVWSGKLWVTIKATIGPSPAPEAQRP